MPHINDKKIVKTSTLNCNLDKAWWKWTTHEGLLSFFGPDNKIELALGGKFEIYFLMDNPEGSRGGEGNKIISFLPNQMLSFTWNSPPNFAEVRNHEHSTWVVVNFNAIDSTKTEVTLTHLGWIDGKEWDEVFEYFESAWDNVMGGLKESCE